MSAANPARLADGVELIGKYEGSGLKDPPYIARRPDGNMVQLPPALYHLAEQIDGERTDEELSEVLSAHLQRDVGGEDIRYLVDDKLVPLGIAAPESDGGPSPETADAVLALKFKVRAVPAGFVRGAASILRPLFLPPVVVTVLAALVAFDVWFFTQHGAAPSVRAVLEQPVLLLAVIGLVVVSTVFHEFGHATACRYGGATPGVMGVGLYLVWPAFYTDVTDAYRLVRAGRIRTDLGGLYFNAIFILATAGAYWATGWEVLLAFVLVQHFQMFQQFLPFVRLDGYYVISDLVGVPDLFGRIGPTLKSLLPWRKTPDSVRELKPWARAAVSTWVLIVVPILIFNLTLITVHAPRIFATSWKTAGRKYAEMSAAFGEGSTLDGVSAGVNLLMLVLPALGITLMMTNLTRRIGVGAWRWSDGEPVRRASVMSAGAVVLAMLAYAWWPSPAYQPIQEKERWTIQEAARQIPSTAQHREPLAEVEEPEGALEPTPEPKATPSPLPTPDAEDSDATPDPVRTPESPATPNPVTPEPLE